MLDFSSSLYLGMRHPRRVLKSWEAFTTGMPAALSEPDDSLRTAQELAKLQGCERAVMAPSTLHLFWDLFGILGSNDLGIYMDDGVYPIARWGVERAVSHGAIVQSFPHRNSEALKDMIRKNLHRRRRALILSDGFCPSCGKPAPVSDYLSIAEGCGGLLILDDTQALGIFGHSPTKENPYGLSGGGILQWSSNTMNPHVLIISSMAKGFGVPVAVLSGGDTVIKRYREKSKVRVHCSPPSNAVIHAARHALALNRRVGDSLRQHLLKLVRHLRELVARAGFPLKGGIFPVQTIPALSSHDAGRLHERFRRQGVKTVLHQGMARKHALISFLINAVHSFSDIDYLTNALINLTRHRNQEVTYEIQT